jgi:hypothetical protein
VSIARRFLVEVVRPNVNFLKANPDSIQAAFNAIVSIDSFVGAIAYAQFVAENSVNPGACFGSRDKILRDEIADKAESYRLIRDAAFSFKHGQLSGLSRTVRTGDQIRQASTILNASGTWRDQDLWSSFDYVFIFETRQSAQVTKRPLRADIVVDSALCACRAAMRGTLHSHTFPTLDELSVKGLWTSDE